MAIALHLTSIECDRPSSHKYRMRSPLKLKFMRSPLVPTSFSAIVSQIEILVIGDRAQDILLGSAQYLVMLINLPIQVM